MKYEYDELYKEYLPNNYGTDVVIIFSLDQRHSTII